MLIGMMNAPSLNALEEARWAAEHGFDFLDLTIEGPGADLDQIDVPAMQQLCGETGLKIVGHTAPYLPFATAIERVRRAAVEEVAAQLPVFAALGAKVVNVHITRGQSQFGHAYGIKQNARSFGELAEVAAPLGIQMMCEHPPDTWVGIDDIRTILNADQRLGFHLDVGHAFVGGDKLEGLLKAFGSRLAHVHMADNRGRADDHMPLGAGRIDWPRAVRLLQAAGYDGTITLEVFAHDRDFLLLSAEKLRGWWNQ